MSERIAFFRPDDERTADAAACLRELGVVPVSDPLLEIRPTQKSPRTDADLTVLTSRTGVEVASNHGWTPSGSVVAIGAATAEALRSAGYAVDRVPQEYSSAGLVAELRNEVEGKRVEVARSDQGSPVLIEGLREAGAYVHETILYDLIRPDNAGESTELAASGDLAGVCFTSTLTVEHFLEAAADRDIREEAIAGLHQAVVGAIGDPTREAAEAVGIPVDVVPEVAEFEALARCVVEQLH